MSSIHTASDLNLCMYRVNRNCIDVHCIDSSVFC
jgi:hypothetical protein